MARAVEQGAERRQDCAGDAVIKFMTNCIIVVLFITIVLPVLVAIGAAVALSILYLIGA